MDVRLVPGVLLVREVHYVLSEAKLISLLYSYLVRGFTYGVLADEPMGSDDYDPFDKEEGQRLWVMDTSKETRKKLRRYRQRQPSNGSTSHD